MKKVITAQDIRDTRKAGLTSLTHPADAIVTPQARDDARSYGIALQAARTEPEKAPQVALEPAKRPVSSQKSLQSPEQALGRTSLWDMVRAQVAAKLGPAFDAAAVEAVIAGMAGSDASGGLTSGAKGTEQPTGGVAASGGHGGEHGVTLVQHSGPPAGRGGASPSSGLLLTDVLASDAGGPGVGYLDFASSSFTLVFPDHEVVTVLEGELGVTVQEKTVKARAGEAVRIAAGTSVTLSATGPVRCLYTAWPGRVSGTKPKDV